MTKETIIDRIRKCLALATNNSNVAEAESAMLMAQRLMAKHGVGLEEVQDEIPEDEKIVIEKETVGTGCAWKFTLAHIVADNFRCKTFSYGKSTVAFYGRDTDAKAAKEVFVFLFKLGHKLALKARADHKKDYGYADGIYNSFVVGFCTGIKTKLGEQSKALMIVISEEVKKEYEEFIKGAKTSKGANLHKSGINSGVYEKGFYEGKSAVGTKQVEGGK